jgi:hypothetical protein
MSEDTTTDEAAEREYAKRRYDQAIEAGFSSISIQTGNLIILQAPDRMLVEPGEHIAIMPDRSEPNNIRVRITGSEENPEGITIIQVTYNFMDLYDLTIIRSHPAECGYWEGQEVTKVNNVYREDLGKILFGTEAKPPTGPMYTVTDGAGNTIAEG